METIQPIGGGTITIDTKPDIVELTFTKGLRVGFGSTSVTISLMPEEAEHLAEVLTRMAGLESA